MSATSSNNGARLPSPPSSPSATLNLLATPMLLPTSSDQEVRNARQLFNLDSGSQPGGRRRRTTSTNSPSPSPPAPSSFSTPSFPPPATLSPSRHRSSSSLSSPPSSSSPSTATSTSTSPSPCSSPSPSPNEPSSPDDPTSRSPAPQRVPTHSQVPVERPISPPVSPTHHSRTAVVASVPALAASGASQKSSTFPEAMSPATTAPSQTSPRSASVPPRSHSPTSPSSSSIALLDSFGVDTPDWTQYSGPPLLELTDTRTCTSRGVVTVPTSSSKGGGASTSTAQQQLQPSRPTLEEFTAQSRAEMGTLRQPMSNGVASPIGGVSASSSTRRASVMSGRPRHAGTTSGGAECAWELVDENELNKRAEQLEVEDEFRKLEQLVQEWDQEGCGGAGAGGLRPFAKNVVTVLGTTSSGKTSFVNDFFGVSVKKVAACQQDTYFTLIETTNEEEFCLLVPAYVEKAKSGRTFTAEELTSPIIDPHNDLRRDVVYTILDTTTTLSRHPQFEPLADTFRKNQLLRDVVINEAYLPRADNNISNSANNNNHNSNNHNNNNMNNNGKNSNTSNNDSTTAFGGDDARAEDQARWRRITRTIVIDSPGFTGETQLKRLIGNLSVLQHMYSISDLTLFFVPALSLNDVTTQIHMLELSLLYASHGEQRFNECLERNLADMSGTSSGRVVGGGGGGGMFLNLGDLLSRVGRNMVGAIGAQEAMDRENKRNFHGSTNWDRVRFVISKVDQRTVEADGQVPSSSRPSNHNSGRGRHTMGLESQFFELGAMLGKKLKFMSTPVFDQCYAISTVCRNEDLLRLRHEIGSLHAYDSYLNRLETAIQMMCDRLRESISKTWWGYVHHPALATVDDAYKRSKMRTRLRAGGRTS
eukprot:TRINITY_DN1313_c1_g1_i1.p1 TRINITY_DN1313_c1_g1~~TRINITY_DN1313_c1_g1_i1.p1  ORF type:complete len:874 (-),score=192.16 TRINITY_DN1313_c1_g1_i1:210-2831(-)